MNPGEVPEEIGIVNPCNQVKVWFLTQLHIKPYHIVLVVFSYSIAPIALKLLSGDNKLYTLKLSVPIKIINF